MSVVKAVGMQHVRYRAPDLGRMATFLEDFGLHAEQRGDRLFARSGRDGPVVHITELGEPAPVGFAITVNSSADLALVAEAEGAAIEPLDVPDGGSVVRLTDPDGWSIEVVSAETVPFQATDDDAAGHAVNRAGQTVRVGRAAGCHTGPARVARLGHCVLEVTDFSRSLEWYTRLFGFLPSDEIEVAPGMVLGAFLRCDLGEEPTDHHALFLGQSPTAPRLNHAAFEVAGFDDLMAGHDHLSRKGAQHYWGVGRHILGHQIFDYWQDPWGNVVEHWTDGDRLVAADPVKRYPLEIALGTHWGPAAPAQQ